MASLLETRTASTAARSRSSVSGISCCGSPAMAHWPPPIGTQRHSSAPVASEERSGTYRSSPASPAS
eukprot:2695895-Prymnesium_polylepis.1